MNVLWCLIGLLTPVIPSSADEHVCFFPASGWRDGSEWVIELRYWVHEERSYAQSLASKIASELGELTDDERRLFEERAKPFLADSESREIVVFEFEHDSSQQQWQLTNENGDPLRTDANGLAVGQIRLPVSTAETILKNSGDQHGWMSLKAVSAGHQGRGRVRLIEPEGLSLISDIDDTVKVTEIYTNSETVFRNTFLREFKPTTELKDVFRRNVDCPVHYVSGGPWQLYQPLREFLDSESAQLPEGSFHMRNLRKNLLTTSSWRDFANLVVDSDDTMEHKISSISWLMTHYPRRRFLLIGDSGEHDPEVYREIRKRFPEQVTEILIRDVTNDRTHQPQRLDGMTIVPMSK